MADKSPEAEEAERSNLASFINFLAVESSPCARKYFRTSGRTAVLVADIVYCVLFSLVVTSIFYRILSIICVDHK